MEFTFSEINKNQKKISKINAKDILYNMILGNEVNNYSNLKYDESIIFNDVEYYNNFIIEKLNELKKYGMKSSYNVSQKIKNFTKSQTLNTELANLKFPDFKRRSKKISQDSVLILKSFYIYIENVQDSNNRFEFFLPFDLVPLFYYDNMKNIQLLLTGLFSYKDNKFDLNLEETINILSNNKYFSIPQAIISQKSKLDLLRYISKEKENFNKKLLRKLETIDIDFDDKNFSKRRFSASVKKLNGPKSLYREKWSIMEFFWLTGDDKKYKFSVQIPEIEFSTNDLIIKKYINNELLLLLIKEDFKDWEFFVMKYLISFKVFRNIMQLYFSKKDLNYIQLINLTRNNIFPIYTEISRNRTFDNKLIIYLSKEKKFTNSIYSKNYFFIYSDKNGINYYKFFHNYIIITYNKNINPINKFIFHFNYEQMKKIYFISKRQGLSYFFAKILENDTQNMKIKLNYDLLNRYTINDINYLSLYSPTTSNNHCCEVLDKKKDGHRVIIRLPILETIEYISENSNKFFGQCFITNINEYEKEGIPLNILEEICKCDKTDNWPEILIKVESKINKDDINIGRHSNMNLGNSGSKKQYMKKKMTEKNNLIRNTVLNSKPIKFSNTVL